MSSGSVSVTKSLNDLTHLFLMLHFYTPRKHQNTFRFSDVFCGNRNVKLGKNGVIRENHDFVINF